MKWLTGLWAREWNCWGRQMVSHMRAELLFLLAVFLVFVVNKSLADRLSDHIASVSEEVRAFWGLSGNVDMGNSLLYLRWALMPLNVWVAWKTCRYSVQTFWSEEERGSIFLMCNQWYSREQIGIAKYTWSLVNFAANYTFLFIAVTALVLMGSGRGARRMDELGVVWGVYLKGIFVMVMLISVCCSYAMCCSGERGFARVEGILFGTLAAGNFYKLTDLLALWMERAGRNDISLIRWLGWTRNLRFLSPLSWLNPFTEAGLWERVLQIAACVMVSAGATVIGLSEYRIRKLGKAEVSVE